MLTTALVALALAPAAADADAPPLTADYTATDISGTNHQWYVTGTTTTATTIATGGSVTFNYVTGNPATTRHSVAFTGTAKPTECTPALGATSGYPTPPARAPWVTSCRFDTPGSYPFVCQIHPTMRGTVDRRAGERRSNRDRSGPGDARLDHRQLDQPRASSGSASPPTTRRPCPRR